MIADFWRRHRFAIGLAVALLVVGAIIFVSYRGTRESLESSAAVAHTHEVISTLSETLAAVEAAETAQRAFLITGNENYRADALAQRPRVAATLSRLERLVSDNPAQHARAQLLRLAVVTKLGFIDRSLRVRQAQGFEAARDVMLKGQGTAAMRRVKEIIATMAAEERRLLDSRARATAAHARSTEVFLLLGGLADVALIAIIYWFVRRDQRHNRELRAAMAEARDAAIRSAEMRSQFLANMSHEIRTPMNAIIGMTGLLLDSELTADQRELAQTVRTSGDALLTIINDILDFSKIEAGKLAIEESDFDFRTMIESVIDLFTESAHVKKIDIGALVDHTIPRVLHGDAGRIRQVLTNLVGNAIKFTDKGDVIVHVTREAEDDARVTLKFSVTDTGIGIAPQTLARLFQPFHASRRHDHAPLRRHRPRPGDLAASRRDDGRHDRRGVGRASRLDILVHAAARSQRRRRDHAAAGAAHAARHARADRRRRRNEPPPRAPQPRRLEHGKR